LTETFQDLLNFLQDMSEIWSVKLIERNFISNVSRQQ